MKTFQEMGLPFPLFLAPVSQAIVDPPGNCVVCGTRADLRFAEVCYPCFRDGKAQNVVDTELGMVTHEDAANGMTHGIPLADPSRLSGYELVPHPVDPNVPDEKWYHVRVAPDHLQELIRTPRYHTWQGERWLFCCHRPSAFLGSLPAELIAKPSRPVSEAISEWIRAPKWDGTLKAHGSHTYYLFRCLQCGKLRFNDDCD
jgi:uncharacterized protein CbrC (UPF0167 family)